MFNRSGFAKQTCIHAGEMVTGELYLCDKMETGDINLNRKSQFSFSLKRLNFF